MTKNELRFWFYFPTVFMFVSFIYSVFNCPVNESDNPYLLSVVFGVIIPILTGLAFSKGFSAVVNYTNKEYV
jgi:hypothetical protein